MKCTRCNRKLKRPPVMVGGMSFGPKCAQAMYGAKPARVAREDRRSADDRQKELFQEATA